MRVLIICFPLPADYFQLAKDLLHPLPAEEKRKHKLKRLVQHPNSYFMDVKCPGCYRITTVFSHAQGVVVCAGCATILCQPTGGRAKLTEGESALWAKRGSCCITNCSFCCSFQAARSAGSHSKMGLLDEPQIINFLIKTKTRRRCSVPKGFVRSEAPARRCTAHSNNK
ncbi:blast:40S ribosomal protein S27 [Drosophila guanche]|uniref:40S ribosomal protein S27 n=1 Tax=Drosophila guanche TaxID=7266 RepID=A0A3B0JNW0_DROGU|nr:blast:40S ribosomal protein S27 [Drosophila guanche]